MYAREAIVIQAVPDAPIWWPNHVSSKTVDPKENQKWRKNNHPNNNRRTKNKQEQDHIKQQQQATAKTQKKTEQIERRTKKETHLKKTT